ncbi:hypothetical protein ES702_03859 [subsurface metagenome]
MDYGAATSLILTNRVKVGSLIVHRYLKRLKTDGIIEKATRITGLSGARPIVWKVPDANIDLINDAISLHRKLSSPRYCMSEEMAQLILEEYILPQQKEEISSREYQVLLKERGIKPSLVPDLTMFGMRYLKTQGIRVSWS